MTPGETTTGRPEPRPRGRRPPIALALAGLLAAGAGVFLVATWTIAQADGSAMRHLVPGDSRRGASVFKQRGCNRCHGMPRSDGTGGVALPALGAGPLTAGEIAARMWNHGPRMWARMKESGLAAQPISSQDMADLFAFFYYLGLDTSPGDPDFGGLLFKYKGCDACHDPGTAAIDASARGPAVRYWSAHTSPLSLVAAMWNHAEGMSDQVRRRGGRWPQLDGDEIDHIVAYVRRSNTIAENRGFQMGDPAQGMTLFRDKGCATCHAQGEDRRQRAPSIEAIGKRTSTLAGMAGRMWSHYPEMVATLDPASIQRLRMTGQEIGDIVAYLFAVGYFDDVGDRGRGGRVFVEKGCVSCHSSSPEAENGVAWLRTTVTPADFSRSMWNHGPRMAEAMQASQIPWPELSGQEIVDLIAYVSE